MSDSTFEDVTSLQARLDALRIEHRDLDEAIARLGESPAEDELLLRRLKKRKLALKDRIAMIEHMLEPDERA
jgi:hypothetical protein